MKSLIYLNFCLCVATQLLLGKKYLSSKVLQLTQQREAWLVLTMG